MRGNERPWNDRSLAHSGRSKHLRGRCGRARRSQRAGEPAQCARGAVVLGDGCGSFGRRGSGDRGWHSEVGSDVHVEIPWNAREASARFGHALAIVRRGEPVQFQLWVRIFGPQSQPTRPAIAERRAFTGLWDDEGMPLICPTCQLAIRAAAAACYFAWGCFRYFWERAFSRGSSPTSPAVKLTKARCKTSPAVRCGPAKRSQ